jgi:hypothetical protein
LSLDNQLGDSGGKYELLCSLSPGSTLFGYRLYEPEGGYDDMTDYDQ